MSAVILSTYGATTLHLPAPIVGLAICAAVVIQNRTAMFTAFFAALLASDLILGLHALMPVVYGSLALILLLGLRLRERLSIQATVSASVISSMAYYLTTNLGVWIMGGCELFEPRQIPFTFAGLVDTYAAALPMLPARICVDLAASMSVFLFAARSADSNLKLSEATER
jgi:hypothetical protein